MPFNKDIKLDVMFSLNPLNVETLYRFMKIEWPDYGPFDNNENLRVKWRTLNTISAFYARIRVCYSLTQFNFLTFSFTERLNHLERLVQWHR